MDKGKSSDRNINNLKAEEYFVKGRGNYENLFNKLDVNKDGLIDIQDLTAALSIMGMSENVGHAKIFMKKSKTGSMDLTNFVSYIKEHENKLLLVFKSLDINLDGRIDVDEVQKAFKKLGIIIDRKEAECILKRMDRDGSLDLDFEEWRNYLLFHQSTELADIMRHWRHATVIDIGEDSLVPDDFTEAEMVTGEWWRHLVAGGIASAFARTCTAPFDRLKLFFQVYGRQRFKNIQGCLTHMVQEGGITSLWRGNIINVLKIAPESALKFMAYEQAKQIIRGNKGKELTMYERFLAGSFAGSFSQTIIYPLEVLKTRLALSKTGQYNGIWDAVSKIHKKEGLRSFYRGYLPNLLGIIPYAGIDFAAFETLKKLYIHKHNEDMTTPAVIVVLACGSISSTCGQIANYPLALVRTRLQAQTVVTDAKIEYTMIGMFRYILQNEGIPGLYRGIAANFLKITPAISISYAVYERSREKLTLR